MKKFVKHTRNFALRSLFKVASHISPKQTGIYLAKRFVRPAATGRTLAASIFSPMLGVKKSTLSIEGNELATYQWGNPGVEPYVLLAHGWDSYGLRFAEWVPALRAMGYAVVSFDQPAHGLSGGKISHMPQFVDTLRQIGRHFGRPAAYVGHSLGASAIVFAQEEEWCPERFVLIAPFIAPAENVLQRFSVAGIPNKVFPPFEGYIYSLTGHKFSDYDSSLRLSFCYNPALVIHDVQDRETPWAKGALFAQLWPGARIFTTQGLGHNRLLDDPTVIREAMNFIRGGTDLAALGNAI